MAFNLDQLIYAWLDRSTLRSTSTQNLKVHSRSYSKTFTP